MIFVHPHTLSDCFWVQAVSLAVQRLEGDKTPDIEQFLVHDKTSMSPQEKKIALLDIKRAIFAVLESEDK